jgi:hypothetical protein
MQFEVQMEARPEEVLTYCYDRIREIWPEAIMVDSEGTVFERQLSGPRSIGKEVKIYQGKDSRLTSRFFGVNCSPSLTIDIEGGLVTVTPSKPAAEVSEKLATLPIWVHKARESSRVKAV